MAQWFRLYESVLDDPKVQRLHPELFKTWVNLLCLACRHDGVLPPIADIAFAIRLKEDRVKSDLAALGAHGLLEKIEDDRHRHHGSWVPHNWASRQFKSDASAERMKRHRHRHRNVTVTPSESETDTETDSVPNGTGADAPSDPVKLLFDEGVKLLTDTGSAERSARTIIGKWRAEQGNEATLSAIRAAREGGITEPIAWITTRFAGKPREDWNTRRIREGMKALGL